MGPGAQFAWQHDAVQVSDEVLTVFDNGTNGPLKTESQARGLELAVDESRRTATVRHAYTTADRLLPGAMGSVQILPSGNVVVGWGVDSLTSEFTADGALLFGASLPEGMYSYRGLRLPWTAAPHHAPADRRGDETRRAEQPSSTQAGTAPPTSPAGRSTPDPNSTTCARWESPGATGSRRSYRSSTSRGSPP